MVVGPHYLKVPVVVVVLMAATRRLVAPLLEAVARRLVVPLAVNVLAQEASLERL